jgi:serine/threonine-protein kinase
MPLAEGQPIAGYTILRSIGAGGMGEVYLAQHPRLPRQDALKVLPASVSADQEYRQRFIREADIAATLWHPHIVEVHDRGEFEERARPRPSTPAAPSRRQAGQHPDGQSGYR